MREIIYKLGRFLSLLLFSAYIFIFYLYCKLNSDCFYIVFSTFWLSFFSFWIFWFRVEDMIIKISGSKKKIVSGGIPSWNFLAFAWLALAAILYVTIVGYLGIF